MANYYHDVKPRGMAIEMLVDDANSIERQLESAVWAGIYVGDQLAQINKTLGDMLGDGSHLDKLVRTTRDVAEGVQEATK